MQSSGDETFDDFQGEFVEYLQRRLGAEREQVIAMLARWLENHANGGRPDPTKAKPDLEPKLEHTSR
jgi:hypothetical protein